VISGTDTIFLGQIKHINEFEKKCNLCGNCIIDKYDGLCPITRCPKNMLNGPCGGSIEGKCEIDNNMDCIWHLIYKKLKKKNRLKELREIYEPFDWSNSKTWRIKI
ncbi:MAG: methylenetetrahydrofolate reductase C-terminal domain-containing protein, partial [Thermoplasmatales archaeon]|nr:methylenetetrahydrofolate reductase C-terminal domain-containing protein [Thermoplasmatales archaeon]